MEASTEFRVPGAIGNCTVEAQHWLGNHVTWQCLDDIRQLLGLSVGVLAALLWAGGHICFYRWQRLRVRSSRQRSVRLFVTMNWFSDALGLVGAGLAQQLLSQFVFGVIVTGVHTICCIHSFVSPVSKQWSSQAKRDLKKLGRQLSRKSLFRACICPLNAVLLTTACASLSVHVVNSSNKRTASYNHIDIQTWIPVAWLVGYIFGSMAGVLHCFVKVLDILDSYMTVDFNRSMGMTYVVSIFGELGYFASVMSQRNSVVSYRHTLPWILPRLIAAGLDIGILAQRITQRTHGKRRKISEEDAECLLSSSESEHGWLSSDSEEVIWMPLKTVDSAIPTHPVATSRVQILSETYKSIDTVDWVDSLDDSAFQENTINAEEDGVKLDNGTIGLQTIADDIHTITDSVMAERDTDAGSVQSGCILSARNANEITDDLHCANDQKKDLKTTASD